MNRLNHETLRHVLGAVCFTPAGLAIGTTTTDAATANAIDYCIDGVIYEKAVTDDLVAMAGDEQGEETKALYLVGLDASGNPKVWQSAIVGASETTEWPEIEDGYAPIGGVKVVTASATFDPGTDGLDKSGVTDTYYDLARVPAGEF